MGKINLLPASVYNRIAAGEVVDRPYSAVKELVENSIDAGAKEIEIYVENGGKETIRVVDDGAGISREDLPAAFLPHATSKISRAEDLESIVTLGFRGEAVASIASVSKMTILSREEGKKCYSLTCNGGVLGEVKEAGESFSHGTDVCVSSLFFNAPVRLRFLKTDRAEEADITTFVARFILARPEISFRYYVNGKIVLQSFGEGDEAAFACVYGAETLQNCYAVNAEKHGIKIRGYIGNQNFSKPNKSYQTTFLNGRYISNQTVAAALSNAYANYLMKRQYPFYVLHIDVPPEIVDVNVHPNKADVRFCDNKTVYGCIYRVVSEVLDGNASALEYLAPEYGKPRAIAEKTAEPAVPAESAAFDLPRVFAPTLSYEEARRAMNAMSETPGKPIPSATELPFSFNEEKRADEEEREGEPARKAPAYSAEEQAAKKRIGKEEPRPRKKGALFDMFPDLSVETPVVTLNSPCGTVQSGAGEADRGVIASAEEYDAFEENKKYLLQQEAEAKARQAYVASFTYAGKLFNTYLLYEREDEVLMIDQHAAHERLIYNRLKEKMQLRQTASQSMLIPYELRVNAGEKQFLRDNLENIRAIGFEIDETEPDGFSVRAVPADLTDIDLSAFFAEILNGADGYRAIKIEDLLRDKLATAACKAAVKGGDDLSKAEINELFRLIDGNFGLRCPHGRPVVVRITKNELEKMFKRIV